MLLGGWVNDALVRRGRPEERLRVAALASAATPLLWLPGLLLHCLLAALPALAEGGTPFAIGFAGDRRPAGRRGCALPPPTQRTRRRPGSPEGETGGSPT